MKNVIITGGTGFIGSWLVDQLLQNNVEIYALVRNPEKAHALFNNPLVHIIEYKSAELSKLALNVTNGFDAMYHLAWNGVSTEHKNDITVQLNNVSDSVQAIEFAKKNNCKKFIAIGTVAEYVFCDNVMDVYAKQSPNDMYGASKVATHYYLDVLSRKLNQEFIWTVIPSTFGERRDDLNIITYTIKTLLQGKVPQYGNLEQMWDFLYVSEVARALVLIGEYGIPGKTYGIGSGKYYPLKNYITKIRDIIDPNLKLGIGARPEMSEKTFSSCVNISELTKDTGFMPQISFDEGIRKTIEYVKNKDRR